jgi:hypothetical protein
VLELIKLQENWGKLGEVGKLKLKMRQEIGGDLGELGNSAKGSRE